MPDQPIKKWVRGGTKANSGAARAGIGPFPRWDSRSVQRHIQGPFPDMSNPVKPRQLPGTQPVPTQFASPQSPHSIKVKTAAPIIDVEILSSKKVAGPIPIKQVLSKVAPDLIGVPIGVGAGYGLTKLESNMFELNPAGQKALGYMNMGLGSLAGSRWGRQMLRHPVRDSMGNVIGHGKYDPKKFLATSTGLAAKTLGTPLIDSITGAAKGWEKSTQHAEETLADIKGAVNQALTDFTKSVTGREPGKSVLEADADRMANVFADRFFASLPSNEVTGGKTLQESEIDHAWEKSKQSLLEKYPQVADKLGPYLDKVKGPAVKQVKEWNPDTVASANNAGVNRMFGELTGTFENLNISGSGFKDIIEGAKLMGDDLNVASQNITRSADRIVKAVTPFSQIGEKLQDPKTWKTIGAVGLGAGASLGAYNLLRDYLNYRRISREKERERNFRKSARIFNPLVQKIIGGTLGAGISGTASYIGADAAGMSPAEKTTFAALMAGMGGLTGVSGVRSARSSFAAAPNEGRFSAILDGAAQNEKLLGATVISDLFGGATLSNLRSSARLNNAETQKLQTSKTNTLGDIAKGVGLGGLGLAGIYALIQGARAAKSVAEGNSLVDVNAETKNNIFSGPSGGPENPNVGGKVYVTLPTKNPDDKETIVELPLENVPLPNAVINKVKRDTKRRLRSETAARTIPKSVSSPGRIRELMAVNRPAV